MNTFDHFLDLPNYNYVYLNNGVIYTRQFLIETANWISVQSTNSNINDFVQTNLPDLLNNPIPIDLVIDNNLSEVYRWIGSCDSFAITISIQNLDSCPGSWYLLDIETATPIVDSRNYTSSVGNQFAATGLDVYRTPNHPREILTTIKNSMDVRVTPNLSIRKMFNSDSYIRRRIYSAYSTLISTSSKENSVLKRMFNPELARYDTGKNWKPNIPTPFRYLVFNETGNYYDSFNGLCYDSEGNPSNGCPEINWADLNNTVDLKTSYWTPIIASHDPTSKDPITFGYNPIANREELINNETVFEEGVEEEPTQTIDDISTGFCRLMPCTEEHRHNFYFFTASPSWYYFYFDGENIFIKSPKLNDDEFTTIPIQSGEILTSQSHSELISYFKSNGFIGFFVVDYSGDILYFWDNETQTWAFANDRYSGIASFTGYALKRPTAYIDFTGIQVILDDPEYYTKAILGYHIYIRNLEQNEVFHRSLFLSPNDSIGTLGSLVNDSMLSFLKSVLPSSTGPGDYFISNTYNYVLRWKFTNYSDLVIPEYVTFETIMRDTQYNNFVDMAFSVTIDDETDFIPFSDGHWDVVYSNYRDIGPILEKDMVYNKTYYRTIPIAFSEFYSGKYCGGAILPRLVGYDNIYFDGRCLSRYVIITANTSSSKTLIRQEDDIPFSLDDNIETTVYDRYDENNIYGYATKTFVNTQMKVFDETIGHYTIFSNSEINTAFFPEEVANYIQSEYLSNRDELFNRGTYAIHTSITNNEWTTIERFYYFLYDKETQLFYQILNTRNIGKYCVPIYENWVSPILEMN